MTSPHTHQEGYVKTKTNKQKQNQNARRVGEDVETSEPLCMTVEIQNGATIVKNSMSIPQKIKHRITIRPSSPASGYKPKTSESRVLKKRCLHTHFQCSISHNSQEEKMT